MRKIILTAAILFAAVPAYAGDEVLASRFGNTTLTTDTSGNEVHVYYKADHTLAAKIIQGGNTTNYTGKWEVKDGNVCITYDGAAPMGEKNPTCVPAVAHNVGDKWTANVGGTVRTISIVEGIH